MPEVYHKRDFLDNLLRLARTYKTQHYSPETHGTIPYVMALFLKQNEQRTQLQEKIAADLMDRTKIVGQSGTGATDPENSTILQESQEATGRSVFWVGVVTMVVIALVVFVLFIFNGI
jgi:hypothetical protein